MFLNAPSMSCARSVGRGGFLFLVPSAVAADVFDDGVYGVE